MALGVCVAHTYMAKLNFIDLTRSKFVVQIMDFAGISVKQVSLPIEWRIKSAHDVSLLSAVLGHGSAL